MEALGATTEASLFNTTSINSVVEIPCSAMLDKAKEKMKEEEEELKQPKRGSCSTILLDLSLSNKDSDIGSSSLTPPFFKLDLIASLGSGGEGGPSTKIEGELRPMSPKPEPRVFACKYCRRKFYSSRSLCGHQKAHKHERSLARHAQGWSLSLGLAHGPMHRFPLPLQGAFDGQPLGIQEHSMLHERYAGPVEGLLNGRHGWYQPPLAAPVIDPQPGVGKLFAENYGAASSARRAAVRFDHGAAAAVVGGYRWGGGGDQLSDGKEETQKIDLTLKL